MVNAQSTTSKNIWVASSDGDLDRVKVLIEEGFSPNEKDDNSYTPMHAAASYAHLEILEYLLSVGGDVNLVDDDGETPLFVVETMEAARFLVDHGADVNHKNQDDQTAAEQLEEENPEIAEYLYSINLSEGQTDPDHLTTADDPARARTRLSPQAPPFQPGNNVAIEQVADVQSYALMDEARAIMEQAEKDGVDPDEKLREAVERHVREGRLALGADETQDVGQTGETEDVEEVKRAKVEEEAPPGT